MSIAVNLPVIIDAVCSPDLLAQRQNQNPSAKRICLSLASNQVASSTLSECKDKDEDLWRHDFTHGLARVGLASFRCMEYLGLFLVKDSQSSLLVPYSNLVTFTSIWLAQGIANTALIYKHRNIHEIPETEYDIMWVVKHSVFWTYLFESVVDIANAVVICRGDSGLRVVDVSIVLATLDGISLLNELVYFSVPIFDKAKQILARKVFTGSFFSEGGVSRLEDEPVKQGMTTFRTYVSKIHSVFGILALGIATVVTITGSSVRLQKDKNGFSYEGIILTGKIFIICFVLVALFRFVMRKYK